MIKGRVVRGDGVGKAQGYATANLRLNAESKGLRSGVYAADAMLLGKRYDAALIVAAKKIEVYLLRYKGEDFYGKVLIVDPIQKVSEVIKTNSIAELQAKIAEDLHLVKEVLKERHR